MPKTTPPRRRSQRAQRTAATDDPPRLRQGAMRTRAASSTANSNSSSSDTRLLGQQNAPTTPGEVDGSAGLIAINKQQLEEMIGGMVQAAVTNAVPDAVPGPSTSEQPPTLVSPDYHQTSPTVPTVAVPEESGMTAPVACTPDLHITVSASLRQNIISHRFVDLGSLLDVTDRENNTRPEGSFELVDGRLRPARPPRTISTFSAWSTAFLRYAGIYLQAHPDDALGLINHMRQVSALTAPGLGLAWKEFDEQYRRAREILPDMYRWGEAEANSPIWLNAIARGIAGASAGQARGTPGATRFRPICLSFNRLGGCTRGRCNYIHACSVCRRAHSALRCPQSGPRRPFLRNQRPPTKPAALPATRK